MTSLDIRSNSAVMKRAEQLKRWEESETNQAPCVPRPEKGRKIKFSSGCVFLAACSSGDKDEVLSLLENGADINTANVDGLTALHQACIDDNLEMVEFLVEHGADINRQDNEGWTPLHATASCGFVSIARYLVEHGADVAAVNSDGDLAVDLAVDIQHMPMIEYMQKVVNDHSIDLQKARDAELDQMLKDAKQWLRSDASEADRAHPKTGATALHVAAAKGYTKVLSLLLAGRVNVDKQDNDGWTPLHAAAHWGQKEAAEMLVNAMADMDIRNYSGLTCIDVAERKMVKFLEELRANNKRTKRRPSSQIRISDTIENHNPGSKIIRVEMKPDQTKEQANDDKPMPTSESSTAIIAQSTDSQGEDEAPWRRNSLARMRTPNDSPTKNQVPEKDVSKTNTITETSDVILRRTQSFENDEKKQLTSPPASPANVITTSTLAYTTTTNTAATSGTPIRRSFVPPVRDEESETQRKAHAKRVRETRRSTQGVTLDEIKSAEELVKKKNANMNNNNNSGFKLEDVNTGSTYPPINSTIIPSAPAVIAAANQRRINSVGNAINSSNQSLNSIGRPVSSPPTAVISHANNNTGSNVGPATTPTGDRIALYEEPDNNSNNTVNVIDRKYNVVSTAASSATPIMVSSGTNSTAKSNKEEEKDQGNDGRSALATQAVIQRRRKPKRRSTGVVHLDMDDLDPERQDSANDADDKESGSEQRSSRSRVGSTASNSNNDSTTKTDTKSQNKSDNGEPDYKALWQAARLENDQLKLELLKKEDQLVQTNSAMSRITNATSKNSLSELEKRERRAMERKLSELEEELKLLQKLKTENERLRAENRALTRVVSKLTSSAQSQLSKSK